MLVMVIESTVWHVSPKPLIAIQLGCDLVTDKMLWLLKWDYFDRYYDSNVISD